MLEASLLIALGTRELPSISNFIYSFVYTIRSRSENCSFVLLFLETLLAAYMDQTVHFFVI